MAEQIVQTIKEALSVLCEPGHVIELRVPKVDNKKRTDSGYFTDMGMLAATAAKYDGRAAGVYITLNPVEPALLARAKNHVREWAELTTSDDYIAARRWLPIDCDPKVNGKKRPAGVSSTDAEHQAAIEKAHAIQDYLSAAGWPDPIIADSGNGGALLYRIDLPNDKESADLVAACLRALATRFDDSTADIDTAVFNAARIWKLYGTLAGKGDSTNERPHRRAALLTIPSPLKPVPRQLLQTLARSVEPEKNGAQPRTSGTIEARSWLNKHGIAIAGEKTGKDGSTIYTLDTCPFNADHAAPDACVIQHRSGALVFKCLHSSCQPYDWRALREKMEPGVYERRNGKLPSAAQPEEKQSAAIARALEHLGYSFRLNLCNDTIEVNGDPITDVVRAQIRSAARDTHLKPLDAVEDVVIIEAARRSYHPIRDYLSGLIWDKQLRVSQLAAALHGTDPLVTYTNGAERSLVHIYLWRWMVGACAKVLAGEQNMMLVLVGPQGIGKSSLARWLCSGLPGYFLEGPINVSDKDTDIRLISYFIWEVSELDATTRKADVSALKDFITRATVTVRKSYDRYDTRKPALASMIGTVNESAGFLADETGNRRFLAVRIHDIDWTVINQIDVNQLWAEALAGYRRGETWELQGAEKTAQNELNRTHEIESILEGWITEHFVIGADARMTASEIIDVLRTRHDIRMSGSERSQAMELSRVLTRLGVQKTRTSIWRGYTGIMAK